MTAYNFWVIVAILIVTAASFLVGYATCYVKVINRLYERRSLPFAIICRVCGEWKTDAGGKEFPHLEHCVLKRLGL